MTYRMTSVEPIAVCPVVHSEPARPSGTAAMTKVSLLDY